MLHTDGCNEVRILMDVINLLQIFEHKRGHNEKLLHLRDWKLEIIEKVELWTVAL